MTKLVLLALPLLAAAQQQGAVEGVVFNRVTKAPMAGVRVRMTHHTEHGRYYEGVSNAAGKYRIENVPAGLYAPSYEIPDRFLGPPSMDFYRQRVQVSDKSVTFDIPIAPLATIRGRVLDPEKQPVADARVFALWVSAGPPSSGVTDAEGRFSIDLQPGRYRLQVRAVKWPTGYYPSELNPETAEIISVGEGSDTGGFEIRLRAPAASRIRGVVRADGKPLSGVSLDLLSRINMLAGSARATSELGGVFEFPAVSPGQWVISAYARIGDVRWRGASTLTMADRDVENAEVRIYPPFALDVTFEGLPAQRVMPIRVGLHPVIEIGTTSGDEKDGRAHIEQIFPGAYRVAMMGFTPGRYLKSIFLGGEDITGRVVELNAGSPPLRIVYAPNGGTATGEVENGASAKVVLVPAERDTYVPGMDAFTVFCDAQGRFTMRDLRPGNWYAIAFASLPNFLPNDAIRERVFDRGLWRQATSFRVGEGETATLELKPLTWVD